MAPPTVLIVLRAVRTYAGRMVPLHLLSYPLAVLAAWSSTRLVPGAPRTISAPNGLAASGIALVVLALSWLALNVSAHRWAISVATTRLVDSPEWVDWVVLRLLERASASDRRGVRAMQRVVGALGGEGAGSRAARFALDRVGGSAVSTVAHALASATAGREPMAVQVQRSAHGTLVRAQRRRGALLAATVLAVSIAAGAALAR